MKKLLLLLLIATLILSVSLTGCTPQGSGGEEDTPGENGGGDNPSDPPDKEVGDGSKIDDSVTLIYSDIRFKDLVLELYNACDDAYTETPGVGNDEKAEEGREIVFGKTNREISSKAYSLLAGIERESESDVGFLIYTDGLSVAIAFDDDPSGLITTAEIALDRFIDHCIVNGSIIGLTKPGTILSDSFDLVSYQEEIDQIEVDKAWITLEAELGDNGDSIVAALKQLYEVLPSDDLVSWLANLYDPITGGFYYSNSGRDTNGFLPDIESTAQALGFLSSSGILSHYGNSYNKALPSDMKQQIVYFIKGLQHPNGFFYHPQWSTELTDSKLSRRARDLNNAVSVLAAFNKKPTYNTPNGDKGDGKLADGTPVAREQLTSPLGGSVVAAVSKVIPTAVAVPSHLVDKEAFEKYLAGLDIITNAYSVGNTLTSQKSQIVQRDKDLAAMGADYSLMDILIKWLNDNQQENGLWNAEANYHGVNGLMKISGVYGAANVLLPRADKAVMAAIEAMTTDEEANAVTDVYNTWYAVNRVLIHMNKYGTEEDIAKAKELRQKLYEVAPEAILATAKKLAIFKKNDGSFSYTPANSSATSQGCPVAVPGTNEGDVNATVICTTGTLGCLYEALGIPSAYEVPILTHGDWLEFRTILINLGPVFKDEEKDSSEPVTFDDDSIDDAPLSASAVVRSDGYIKVIKDERGEGNVVELNSVSGASDYLQMSCTSPATANRSCYVFEAELCMTASSSSYPVQIFMDDCYMLTLRKAGNKVNIVESTSSSSKLSRDTKLAPTPALGEWFKIKIEYYKGDAESTRVKLYYNDKLTAVTDGYFDIDGIRLNEDGTPKPSSSYVYSRIYVLKGAACTLLIDNLSTYKINKSYKPVGEGEERPPIDVDAPEILPIPPEMPSFEKNFETYYDLENASGTRYDYSGEITVKPYDPTNAPNGILSGNFSNDSKSSFNEKKSYITTEDGALAYYMSEADWAGFTIANKGNTVGGKGHIYVFEADFTYLAGTLKEGTSDCNIIFAGMTSGNEVNGNMARYNYISMNDKEGSSLSWHGYTFEKGTTYNIRIVSTVGGDYKFYVNGTEVRDASFSTTKGADANTYAGFGFYFRNRCDGFWFAFDNVFIANYAPGEAPEAPETTLPPEIITEPVEITLPDGVDSYFDYSELDGTRYDFSEDISLEEYDAETAPNGIFAGKPLNASETALANGNSSFSVKNGVLEYVINKEDWNGFTIANRGETKSGKNHTYIFEADITFTGGTLAEAGKKYTAFAYAGLTTDNEDNNNFMKYSFVNFVDAENNDISWYGSTFENGVTYKIRIEYVVGGSFKLFVNGVEAANVSVSYAGAPANSYTGFGFYFRKSAVDLTVTFDNVYIGNIAPTVIE